MSESNKRALIGGYFDPERDRQAALQLLDHFERVLPRYAAPVPEAAKPAPGMAVQCLAAEIVEALLADEKEGGYDLIAGMYGPAFVKLVRRWAALEYAAPVASPWQPIETAPKDGSLLLLKEKWEDEPFIGQWVNSAYGGRWAASRTHYDTDGNACVIDRVYSEGVTHWQPLPPAPKEQQHAG